MDKKEKMYANMRAARARKRLESEVEERPPQLPDKRKVITVTNYDFGEVTHTFELFKTSRVDCYKVYVDGKLWKKKVGMSKILEGIRKSSPRVLSPRNL